MRERDRRRARALRRRLVATLAVGGLAASGSAEPRADGSAEPRADGSAEPRAYGWVEWVGVHPGSLTVKAKLDTGATTSSIDAREKKIFERRGERWVRFKIPGREGREVELESPIKRFVRIKRHGRDYDRRPVVELALCLGEQWQKVEVSLANRRAFVYPVLLGRNFLEDVALVDASSTFTAEPQCKAIPAPEVPAEE